MIDINDTGASNQQKHDNTTPDRLSEAVSNMARQRYIIMQKIVVVPLFPLGQMCAPETPG